MDRPIVPSPDEHWSPDHLVLSRKVLAHAGRLFVERDAAGELILNSPLADMAAVEQRYPAWALGPFGRIEPEYALPETPGVYALVSAGVVRYVGSAQNLARAFSARHGMGYISRRDAQRSRREERARLNRLITSEARSGNEVDLYLLVMPSRWSWRRRRSDDPARIAAEIVSNTRGDWHLPE